MVMPKLAKIGEPNALRHAQLTAMAEEVGFEPTVPCGTPVFKTGAFDRSATPPKLF